MMLQIVPYVEGHFTSALEDTDKGEQIYVYPRNGLEIHRRNNLNVYVF